MKHLLLLTAFLSCTNSYAQKDGLLIKTKNTISSVLDKNQCTIQYFNPLQDSIFICTDSVILSAGTNFERYNWSTGDSTKEIFVKQNGWYKLIITDNSGCNATDSCYVTFSNIKIINNDTTICQGSQITIKIGYQNICNNIKGSFRYTKGMEIEGYIYKGDYNNHHYYIAQNPTSWSRANDQAIQSGGYLSCIDDENEQAFVSGLSNDNLWIGYYRDESGNWKWVNCQNTTYTNWRPGEPNAGENFTQILTDYCFGPNQWNNLGDTSFNGTCYSNLFGILEIDPEIATNTKFLWSTGDTTENITVSPTKTTKYYVTIISGLTTCVDSITIYVDSYKPRIKSSGPVNDICPGKTIKLTASAGINYLWNTGATTRSIIVSTSGSYTVMSTDTNGCSGTSKPTNVYNLSCNTPNGLQTENITTTAAELVWSSTPCAVNYNLQIKLKEETNWSTYILPSNIISYKLNGLLPGSVYQWRISTICQTKPVIRSVFSNIQTFTTSFESISSVNSNSLINKNRKKEINAFLYPNPTNGNTILNIYNSSEITEITISDLAGKIIWKSKQIANSSINIPSEKLLSGTYIITIKCGISKKTLKLVKT